MGTRVPSRALVVLVLSCLLALVPAVFDINSASSSQLQGVLGIGPAMAEKIVQMRKSYGVFKRPVQRLSHSCDYGGGVGPASTPRPMVGDFTRFEPNFAELVRVLGHVYENRSRRGRRTRGKVDSSLNVGTRG